MPTPVPRTLAEYPWVVVTVSCKLCSRRGTYRLARLAARYGPDQTLDGLLADLAHGCPYWRTDPRKYDPRCGARFEDLDRLRPQDLPPVEPLHRQRAPAREDLPQPPRRRGMPETPGRPPMLSDWTASHMVVACKKCGRREAYDTATLMTSMGDVTLIEVRLALTADCPRAIARVYTDWCAGLLLVPKGN